MPFHIDESDIGPCQLSITVHRTLLILQASVQRSPFFVEVEPLQGSAPIQSFQNSITLQGKSRVLSLQLGPPGP